MAEGLANTEYPAKLAEYWLKISIQKGKFQFKTIKKWSKLAEYVDKWPNIWQIAEPLALTGCLVPAGCWDFEATEGLAGQLAGQSAGGSAGGKFVLTLGITRLCADNNF